MNIHNLPTELGIVRWTVHLSFGSNGQAKLRWKILRPLDPLDTFVWLPPWHTNHIRYMLICDYLIETFTIYRLNRQMRSNRPSPCPLDSMDTQTSDGQFHVHWIRYFRFSSLRNTLKSHDVYTDMSIRHWNFHNLPTEQANVRRTFHLSIGSNGKAKFRRTIPRPLDPLNPSDTFVWLYWGHTNKHVVCQMITSFKHLQFTNWTWKCPMDIPIRSNGQVKFWWKFQRPLDPLDTFICYLSGTLITWGICWYFITSLKHSRFTTRTGKCPMDILFVHWIQWTRKIPVDNCTSIGPLWSRHWTLWFGYAKRLS